MTMPISLPRSSISPACRQHDLPVIGRVPMLRGCSSSLRQKPPRSVPPSSSAALAAAVELRRLFPGITDITQARECARTIAGWKPLPVARVRSGGGSRVGAGRPDPRPAVSAYSMDKPARARSATAESAPQARCRGRTKPTQLTCLGPSSGTSPEKSATFPYKEHTSYTGMSQTSPGGRSVSPPPRSSKAPDRDFLGSVLRHERILRQYRRPDRRYGSLTPRS
jgi:hypothetical protein